MSKKDVQSTLTGLEIAVVGMACRFPGAKDINQFWQNITNGVESISLFRNEELEAEGIEPTLLEHSNYIKAKGILNDAEYFDSSFFGYTPKEALVMDPQIRIFHECAWEALEDAGYNPHIYNGAIGLIAGASQNVKWPMIWMNSDEQENAKLPVANKDFLATLVAYKLNLKGPSYVLSTACSTSLVAVHQACRALLTGEAKMMLAGGVSVITPEKEGYLYEEDMILSPDGHCRPFDMSAKGTVGGSGAGIVVLKRLKDALSDHDHIYAVIKGTAVNNDGDRKVGYTAPSIEGQSTVIRKALQLAKVEADTICYVETHGTATNLGDPTEIEALSKAFDTQKRGFCALGAVKANIGHLDAAAGIAGFIKTALSLKHQTIPPLIHFEAPNLRIPLINSPFYVNTEPAKMENGPYPLRAGVSAFGIGGTNAHVILEEAPAVEFQEGQDMGRQKKMAFVLSAQKRESLNKATTRLIEHLNNSPESSLPDVAFTLQVGRKHFKHRKLLIGSTVQEVLEHMAGPEGDVLTSIVNEERSITYVIQSGIDFVIERGWALYQELPCFRDEMDHCLALVRRNVDLPAEITNFVDFEKTKLTYIAAFLYEMAFTRTLIRLGITPATIVQDSGEDLLAACIAEVIPLEDAIDLLVLVQRLQGHDTDFLKQQIMRKLKQIQFGIPKIPFLSRVTGRMITPREATDSEYWLKCIFPQTLDQTSSEHIIDPNSVVVGLWPREAAPDASRGCSLILSQSPDYEGTAYDFFVEQIGVLWLQGVDINWPVLYANEERNRLPLPTYPFDSQPYRVPVGQIRTLQNKQTAGEALYNTESWFTEYWRLEPAISRYVPHPNATCVLFGDPGVLVDRILEELSDSGITFCQVQAGKRFEKRNDRLYAIRPEQAEDYELLIDELQRTGNMGTCFFHLWNVFDSGNLMNNGYYSLINLAEILTRQYPDKEFTVKFVTNRMQQLPGDGLSVPLKATAWGALKYLSRRMPHLRLCSIDISYDEQDRQQPREVTTPIFRELWNDSDAQSIALRGQARYVCTTQAVVRQPSAKLALEAGTYVFMGEINEFSEALAKEIQSKIGGSDVVWISRHQDITENDHTLSSAKLDSLQVFIAEEEYALINSFQIKGIKQHHGLEELSNKLCSSYVYSFIKRNALHLAKGSQFDKDDLFRINGIIPDFRKLYDAMLNMLVDDGIAELDGNLVTFLKNAEEVEDAASLKEKALTMYPDFSGFFKLLDYCIGHYPDALTGKMGAIQVLYPEGKPVISEEKYKVAIEHSYSRLYCTLLKDIILKLVEQAPKSKTFRILEVGGGNGILTQVVAPALEDYNVEYFFTDIGSYFISQAKNNPTFKNWKFINFATLDISRDPLGQGFAPSSFDCIVGLNVVHATRNIEESLSNLLRLLSPYGVVALIESVHSERWFDLIDGLAEGWWYFDDTSLRPTSPLLRLSQWEEVFRKLQLTSVYTYPSTAEQKALSDIGLIIAQNSESAAERAAERATAKSMHWLKNDGKTDELRSVLQQVSEECEAVKGILYFPSQRSLEAEVHELETIDQALEEVRAESLIIFSAIPETMPQENLLCINAVSELYQAYILHRVIRRGEYGTFIRYSAQDKQESQLRADGLLEVVSAAVENRLTQMSIVHSSDSPAKKHSMETINNGAEKFLASQYQRSNLTAEFIPPRNETEQLYASILEGLFGVEQVGVDDNFFELGIDSIKAIQIAARLNKSGIKVDMDQILRFPSIAQLVAVSSEMKMQPAHDDEMAEVGTQTYIYDEKDSEQVKALVQNNPNIEAIYPLSPMQNMILSQNIVAYKKGHDVFSLIFKLEGYVDIPSFITAWSIVIERHSILRTAFVWKRLTSPLQMVHRGVNMPLQILDWTNFKSDEVEAAQKNYINEEKRMGFKVDHAPLMRSCLAKVKDNDYRFIWNFQHSLLDGWSMNIVINELLSAYRTIRAGQPYVSESRGYIDYIKWLQKQNADNAEKFWHQEFEGYQVQSKTERDHQSGSRQYVMGTAEIWIDREDTERIGSFARLKGLTVNTIVQTAWALLMKQITGEDDLILGVETSGRSQGIKGIESMVGIFITVLPMRTIIRPGASLIAWMKDLQEKQLNMRRYEYVTVQDIAKWGKVPLDLIRQAIHDRTLVYQNFPMDLDIQDNEGDFRLSVQDRVSQMNVQLRIYVTPGERMSVLISYNQGHYSHEIIVDMLEKLKALLLVIPASETGTLKDVLDQVK
ncbi:methyltransferase [Paenibacillus sp. HN-1]|uniref:condensation domain-containing protein n=1 Tax=Paenibacillus TaxID=44249 RepID=UPI001CA86A74|nr:MULTISPECIES: condensation domain-containing protein [Paenibacillus]MBY9077397.1 methyltransferase [Paenibacillus sp. CGMCC 1.18879]MBY9087494.1 methyltransferase [Paenibacillus sinensis]